MIFNMSGTNSGGGTSSGWVDISSEFMNVNPDIDSIYAVTDGAFVYVSIENPTGAVNYVEVPTNYRPCKHAFGSGFSLDADVIVLYTDQGTMTIADGMGNGILGGSIIYPIATVS